MAMSRVIPWACASSATGARGAGVSSQPQAKAAERRAVTMSRVRMVCGRRYRKGRTGRGTLEIMNDFGLDTGGHRAKAIGGRHNLARGAVRMLTPEAGQLRRGRRRRGAL